MGRVEHGNSGPPRATLGLAALLLVAASLAPLAQTGAQVVPGPVRDTLQPVLEPAADMAVAALENATGADLHSEDIAATLVVDVRNVEDDVVGILFGGGKLGAEGTAHLRLDFRAVSAARLDAALRSFGGDANLTLASFGIPASRIAITAEEIRLIGAGQLLQAFEAAELGAAKDYLQRTVPGLTVLDLSGGWSNTLPASQQRGGAPAFPDPRRPGNVLAAPPIPPLRDPPLVLDATAHLQYVTRVSLLGILQSASRGHDGGDSLQKRIEQTQNDAFLDRSAFRILGVHQLLDFSVPPGWRLNVTLNVPQGFTVEGATDALTVSPDHRTVTYHVDGDDLHTALQQAAVVGLSNRFVVTATVLMLALLAGYVVRFPTEAVIVRWAYGRWRRAGRQAQRLPPAERLRRRLPWGRRHVRRFG